MIIENSPGLEKALTWARRFAAERRAETVQPVHLLEGLLVEEEGMPYRMLADAGVAIDGLRPAYEEDGKQEEETERYPVSARVRHVLKRAQNFARWHSAEGTLTTDLVLLALLDLEKDLRDRLIGMGLDWQAWQERPNLETPVLTLDEPLQLDEPPASDLSRVLDAAGNRAREALRVLEDFARFVLDDAFLTRELKEMRHGLVAALAPLALLTQRDTVDDVGAAISTPREEQRGGMDDVVRANGKRLQEALRSLEEFGKIHSTELGQAMERLRYRAYTLEKALIRDSDRLADARLYVLVTEKLCRSSLLGTVREALEGGADVIQLREKGESDRVLLAKAKEIRKLTRDHGALFIVNDRPDLAALADADGVHLGQDDLPVRAARRILGPTALIGVSTHNIEQVRDAVRAGAGYLGIGPTFPSPTKDFGALAGLSFIEQASRETSLPAFALGGITRDNVEKVLTAGARRVAVSHAICMAAEPEEAARQFKRMLDRG